jgi:hypothetical protein
VQLEFRWIVCNKDNEDYSWDAIWDSKVSLTDFSWVVEMRIPMLLIRFSTPKTNLGFELYE